MKNKSIYNVHKNHVMVIENGVQKKRSMKWWKKKLRREKFKKTVDNTIKAFAAVGTTMKQAGDAVRNFAKVVGNI